MGFPPLKSRMSVSLSVDPFIVTKGALAKGVVYARNPFTETSRFAPFRTTSKVSRTPLPASGPASIVESSYTLIPKVREALKPKSSVARAVTL